MSLRWSAALVLLAVTACGSDTTSSESTLAVTTAATTTTLTTTTSTSTTSTTTTTSTLLSVPETSTSTTSSTTTTTTTSPPPTTTSTTTSTTLPPTTAVPDPAISALVLSGAGIGATPFGTPPDEVIDYVTSFLGPPTRDTDWIDPLSIGVCPGTEVRIVSWEALELSFGDQSAFGSGARHFTSYSYGVDGQVGVGPEGLLTTNGIGLGSSVADLRNAYPDVTLFPEDDFSGPNFFVNESLRGYLTGTDDDSAVTVVIGGDGCGF